MVVWRTLDGKYTLFQKLNSLLETDFNCTTLIPVLSSYFLPPNMCRRYLGILINLNLLISWFLPSIPLYPTFPTKYWRRAAAAAARVLLLVPASGHSPYLSYLRLCLHDVLVPQSPLLCNIATATVSMWMGEIYPDAQMRVPLWLCKMRCRYPTTNLLTECWMLNAECWNWNATVETAIPRPLLISRLWETFFAVQEFRIQSSRLAIFSAELRISAELFRCSFEVFHRMHTPTLNVTASWTLPWNFLPPQFTSTLQFLTYSATRWRGATSTSSLAKP